MADDTKSTTAEPAAETAPDTIPPIESSPEFQDRLAGALGGPPTNPTSFVPVSVPEPYPEGYVARDAAAKARSAAPVRPHDPAYDGPSPELVEARALVNTLAPSLSAMRDALDAKLGAAKEAVAAIKADKLAKAESDLQGIDLKAVEKFLTALDKAQAKDQA
jgi:hypothetical protein